MQRQKGFTVMELIVTIGIIALLASIAIPSYISRLPAKRFQSAVGEIQGILHSARMVAIKENAIVFVDFDVAAEQAVATSGGDTIREVEMPGGVDLTSVTPNNSVKFDSRGLADRSIDIIVTAESGDSKRISLSLSGNSKVFGN